MPATYRRVVDYQVAGASNSANAFAGGWRNSGTRLALIVVFCHWLMMPISTRQFVSTTFALVFLGIAALFAIIGSSVWLSSRAQDLSDAVLKARDAKSIAVDLRSALQAAESSQRGFLYTDNEVYLSPYDQAKQKANAAVGLLPNALTDYPDLSPAIERLTSVARAKVREMDESIALKKAREGDKALSLIRTNRGKLQMDEINVFVTGITLAADDRLAELVNEQTANAVWLQLVSAVNGAIMLVLAGGAIYIVIRYTRELKSAQSQLSRSNDKLEQRVTERTALRSLPIRCALQKTVPRCCFPKSTIAWPTALPW